MKEVDLNELSSDVLDAFFEDGDIEDSPIVKMKKDSIGLKRPKGITNEMLITEINNGINVEKNKELLVRYNYPLAVSIAKRCKCFIPLEDKIAYSIEGLISAINNYDINKGVLFSTYASHAIHMMVMNKSNEHNSIVYIPRHINVHNVNIRKFINDYEKKHGTKITSQIVSDALKLDKDLVELCMSFQTETTSLNTSSTDENVSLIDTIPSNDSTDENDIYNVVNDLLHELDPKEIEIISRICGINGYKAETYDELSRNGFYDKNGKKITVRGTLHYKFKTAVEKLKRLVRLKGLTVEDI